MADNVAITAGSGTTVATDDVSSVHYQKFKLFTSETDAAEGVGDDDQGTYRSLWVTPRVKVATQSQDSSGLTTSVTSYGTGDTLGAGWTFASMARAAGGTGRITGAVLLDDGDVTTSVRLWLASGSITFGTDNAAPSVSDADAAKLLGYLGVSMIDLGANRVGSAGGLAIPYLCDATSLYVYATTESAHSFFAAADDLHLRLFYELD